MLRQQLSAALLLATALNCGAVQEDEARRTIERAEQDLPQGRQVSSQAVTQASDLVEEGTAVRKEMSKVPTIAPARLGSLEGVQPVRTGIDVDALIAKYEQMGVAPGSNERAHVLVFISSSVPKASLQLLAAQAGATGSTLVLRGPIGNDFPSTAEFMQDVIGDRDPKPHAIIDPTLFSRYHVEVVPAVVLVPSGACISGPTSCPGTTPPYVHVAGDVSLAYALEYIARTRQDASAISEALLARLGREP